MSYRYTIEKLDIKKHGNGLLNLWQTVSSKYPRGFIGITVITKNNGKMYLFV